MKYFLQTRTWKLALFIIAALFILGYVFAVYTIISRISANERRQVQVWANTVQKKADMVNYTEQYFKKVREEELRNAEILASAFSYIMKDTFGKTDINFYFKVIESNENIPVVLVDKNGDIVVSRNVDFFDMDTVKKFTGVVKEHFSQYEPIEIRPLKNMVQYLYYTDSKLYSELYTVLDEMNRSFFDETADNIAAVPVIITDSTHSYIYAKGNIPPNKGHEDDSTYIANTLKKMKAQNAPIVVTLPEEGTRYIYYMNSETLVLVRLFPIVQFFVLMVLIVLAYVVFSVARNAEQNRVWAGMAKETAHQLGTPISSMIAWIELLKMQEKGEEIASELEKDISRLHIIADRFSKIGSPPVMDYIDLIPLIEETLNYLKKRISTRIAVNFHHPEHPVCTFTNAQLFSWVIENLTRNAVDAMSSGIGTFAIDLKEDEKHIIIDFSDSGKGIPKNMHRRIFQPGFTTKQRGWGLGLTLVKRILHDNKGKIFVKNSTVGSGSTFRIVMRRCD